MIKLEGRMGKMVERQVQRFLNSFEARPECIISIDDFLFTWTNYGGGGNEHVLMELLKERFPEIEVRTSDGVIRGLCRLCRGCQVTTPERDPMATVHLPRLMEFARRKYKIAECGFTAAQFASFVTESITSAGPRPGHQSIPVEEAAEFLTKCEYVITISEDLYRIKKSPNISFTG